jgi:hypothetical protein
MKKLFTAGIACGVAAIITSMVAQNTNFPGIRPSAPAPNQPVLIDAIDQVYSNVTIRVDNLYDTNHLVMTGSGIAGANVTYTMKLPIAGGKRA